MIYATIDVDLADHEKAIAAGPAMYLWTWAMLWLRKHRENGFIPRHVVLKCSWADPMTNEKSALTLAEVGLWEDAKGGWRAHNYTAKNDTREMIQERIAASRLRQRDYRKRKQLEKLANSSTNSRMGDERVTCNARMALGAGAGVLSSSSLSSSPASSLPDPTCQDIARAVPWEDPFADFWDGVVDDPGTPLDDVDLADPVTAEFFPVDAESGVQIASSWRKDTPTPTAEVAPAPASGPSLATTARTRDSGLFGQEGALWAQGIAEGQGSAVMAPNRFECRELAGLANTFAPGLRGAELMKWFVATAAEYAAETDRKFWSRSVKRFGTWLSDGKPKQSDYARKPLFASRKPALQPIDETADWWIQSEAFG